METTSGRQLGRWLVGGLVGIIAVGGLAVYALKFYLPGLVYQRVRAAASEAKIELGQCEGFQFAREGLEVTHVTLTGCEFKSSLPMRPSGRVEQVDVDLKDQRPIRLVVAGADVEVVGEPDVLQLYSELGRVGEVELVARGINVSWRTSPSDPPKLQLRDLKRLGAEDPWGGEILVGQDLRGDFTFGKELRVTLAHAANSGNVARLTVDLARFTGTANLNLDGLPMTVLSGVLLHKVPPELLTVQLTGSANFDLPFGLNPKQPKGHFKFTFQGLNFPVPREVAGLVYDTSPEIEGNVAINRTFTKFQVENLVFVTGSLRMKGNVTVDRSGFDTRWRTNLRGPLPCDAIAASAAKIHLKGLPLGPELAQAAARISKQAIKGSVEVFVAVDAYSTDLSAAKIVKTIGLGCGLKPLPLIGVASDLIKDLPEISLGGNVGDMLKDLPNLSDLPQLPQLPIGPKLPHSKDKKRATESQPTPAER